MPDDPQLEAYLAVIRARLKSTRLARGLRQEDLAEATGIDLRNIQRLEGNTGKRRFNPEIRTLFKLAQALQADIGDLMRSPSEDEIGALQSSPKSSRVRHFRG